MKKLILAITVSAFTLGAFAGENCCPKDKAACPGKEKAGATCAADKDKATCPMAKAKCCTEGASAKAAGKKLASPKDAGNRS